MLGYGRYIRLKLEEDDGELTQVMTGYPAWKDEIYSESLEEQKEKWFAEEKKTLEAEEHRKAEQTQENAEDTGDGSGAGPAGTV